MLMGEPTSGVVSVAQQPPPPLDGSAGASAMGAVWASRGVPMDTLSYRYPTAVAPVEELLSRWVVEERQCCVWERS